MISLHINKQMLRREIHQGLDTFSVGECPEQQIMEEKVEGRRGRGKIRVETFSDIKEGKLY